MNPAENIGTSETLIKNVAGQMPHKYVRLVMGTTTTRTCAVSDCASDYTEGDRAKHPIHNIFAVPPLNPLPSNPYKPLPKVDLSSREPIYIDPNVRAALHAHLINVYSGTGVGYSEWIRRALTWDQAGQVPDKVQPIITSGGHHPISMDELDEEAQK